MSADGEASAALGRIEATLERQERRLAEIERKLTTLIEMAQRSAETTTRLKLLADLSKEASASQAAAIESIARALGSATGG